MWAERASERAERERTKAGSLWIANTVCTIRAAVHAAVGEQSARRASASESASDESVRLDAAAGWTRSPTLPTALQSRRSFTDALEITVSLPVRLAPSPAPSSPRTERVFAPPLRVPQPRVSAHPSQHRATHAQNLLPYTHTRTRFKHAW